MIKLPDTTYYGKRMPKEKFYSHLKVSSSVKRSFVDDVDFFIWRNKLSSSTLNVANGVKVKEIAIFEVCLKQSTYTPELLELIDKNVPIYVIYILRHGNYTRLHANYKEPISGKIGTFKVLKNFTSDWIKEEELSLQIEGFDLDAIYDNFIRQIAGAKLQDKKYENITEDIEKEKFQETLIQQVTRLENKKRNEKQFNRQLEIADEIKKLKEVIE